MDSPLARSRAEVLPSQTDEEGILQRARTGDLAAFRTLVQLHQARVFSIALRFTGQRADAEELAQDAFVQLHASLGQISNPEHLKHWLIRTVSHRAIDRLRQGARRGHALPLESIVGGPLDHSAESSGDHLAVALVQRLLLQLEPDARAVLLLHFQQDLSAADIAVVLAMSVNTVKSHLRRSMEWLRVQCAGERHES
jgi:RNA polymerase sigma-70 factor (ECF subfamily)